MYHRIFFPCTAIFALFIFSKLPAEPNIKVDNPNFQYGVAIREKTAAITHPFTVRNTGNKPLHIKEVKPGCGCTVVKFDSLILPGKSGIVEQAIQMDRVSDGKIKKMVTVHSDAKNNPKLELSIEATVQSVVSVSQTYVRLTGKNAKEPYEVTLTTQKADFEILKVLFVSKSKPSHLSIALDVPIPVKFEVVKDPTPKAGGILSHTLRFFIPEGVTEAQQGEFLIQTNHPEKKEIKLQGMLES